MELHHHGRNNHSSCLPKAEALPPPLELILEHLPLPTLPKDPRALSYIHLAVEWPEALRVLLAKGADPNSGDHCLRPPLLYLIDMADRLRPVRPESLSILLEFGADIHRTDEWGRSFLTMMRRSTLAMANGASENVEFEGEKLGFAAGLLLRNFFVCVDEKSGEDCVKPRPEALAEANDSEYVGRLAAYNEGKSQNRGLNYADKIS